jgi:hypothetical protein
MKTTNVELEELIGKLYNEIKNVDDPTTITENLTVGNLKTITEKMWAFIDFCKIEFGEDITDIS